MGSFSNVFSLYNPQPVDAARGIAQGMSLRNAMQMNQERAAQTDRMRLENQQLQRNMDAQRAVADAISSSTKQAEDGSYKTDWNAVDRTLTDRGYGREAISMRKERRDELSAAYKAMGDEMDANKKKLEMTGQLLGAHPRVDWSLQQKDPIAFQTQVQQAQIGFKGLLAKGLSMNLLSPEEAQQYGQLPYTPQLEQYLDTIANGALTRQQQIDKARNELNDQVRRHLEEVQTNEAEARLPGIQADTAMKTRANESGTLASVFSSQGPTAYEAKRTASPNASLYPAASQLSGQSESESLSSIRQPGLTPEQAETRRLQEERNTAQSEHNTEMEDLRRQGLELQRDRTSRDSQQTRNSQAVDRRLAENEVRKAEELEGKWNGMRRRIGAALSTGKDAKGNPVEQESLMADYETATDELRRLLQNKYDAAQRAGRTNTVSLDEALRNLEMGDQALYKGLAAKSVGDIDNQADWDSWRAQQPQAIYSLIPQKYTPENAKMVQNWGSTTRVTQASPQNVTGNGSLASAVQPAAPPAPTATPAATPSAGAPLPPAARAALKEGKVTTFRNGQSWTLRNGQPVRLNP